jgi:hypothetical protein
MQDLLAFLFLLAFFLAPEINTHKNWYREIVLFRVHKTGPRRARGAERGREGEEATIYRSTTWSNTQESWSINAVRNK